MKSAIACAVLAVAALVTAPDAALAQTGAVTLKGQVVCSDCWFEQKDRKANPYGTTADLKCAARCSKNDIPQALAVFEGDNATLYLLENGAFTKPGKDFLEFVGKQVELTGTTRSSGGKAFFRVDTLKVISDGTAARSTIPEPPIGADAPSLALKDLSGQEQTLASYRGKIVVLNFWATWCVPCRKEMPAFVKLQSSYAAWGVQVVAASADSDETAAQIVKFVRDKKLSFPVWTGATTDHMLSFGLGSELPGTVIIDRDGKIVARYKGVINEADIEREIDALLAKQRAGLDAPDEEASRASVPS